MIVDGHVHITNDPEPARGWPPFSADHLVNLMDEELPFRSGKRIIDHAAVMPMLLPTQRADLTFRQQHQVVIDAVRRYPDRLVGTFMLNPHLGVEKGITEMRRLVNEDGFRMVKLHPTAHAYWPKMRDFTDPVLAAAADLGIPVLIHNGRSTVFDPCVDGAIGRRSPCHNGDPRPLGDSEDRLCRRRHQRCPPL